MRELLQLLTDQLLFLLDPGGYAIVNSAGQAGGSALLELEKDPLRWRLSRDRGEVTLECRACHGNADDWFTLDILIDRLGGTASDALVNDKTAAWLRSRLPDVEALFSPDALAASLDELHALERVRAKRLFGREPR